jgi:hypothetical protein
MIAAGLFFLINTIAIKIFDNLVVSNYYLVELSGMLQDA